MVNLAVLGHGTVGSGVAEVLLANRDSLEKKAGQALHLKYILKLHEFPDTPYKNLFTRDFQKILEDDSVQVVAEVIGGLEPAYRYTKACLERGKSVVTANKELVAQKGAELLEIARMHHVNYLFEASVGGGIPIIRPLHMCLAANRIEEIAGILNGTTNFILTKMIRENMAFSQALALAQQYGYAESDPRADVEGHDACRKICILASLAFGEHIFPDDVYTEGITNLTLEDVAYAASDNRVIKLIGRAKRNEDGMPVCAMVTPALIRRESQLGTIGDVFNGILVRGNATGDVVFYGKGAGKLPTASAVVGDLIECVKLVDTSPSLRWNPSKGKNVAPREENVTRMYLRCTSDTVKLFEAAKKIFGEVQPLSREGQPADEYAFITGAYTERELDAAIERLCAMDVCVLGKVRVLDY